MAAELPALLGRSEELRAFLGAPAHAAVTEVHALLGMLKEERNVFAPAVIDGALRQDVAQTTVSFDKPAAPAAARKARRERAEVTFSFSDKRRAARATISSP